MRKLKRKSRPKNQSRAKSASSARQQSETRFDTPAGAPSDFGSRRGEFERMWREQFPEHGKKERIRRTLKALQEIIENPIGPNLDLETVKKIAEDPDLWEF